MNYNINDIIPIKVQFTLDEVGIVGATVNLKIQRASDNYFYDFSDNSFKETPITDETSMIDENDGYYKYLFNTSGLSEDTYEAICITTYETINYTKKPIFKTVDFAKQATSSSIESKIDIIDTNLDAAILTINDTNLEVKQYDNYKADVTALSLEATSQTILANTITTESKIDIVDVNIDDIKNTIDTNLDATITSRLAAVDYVTPDNLTIIDNNNKLITLQLSVDALENISVANIWDYNTSNLIIPNSIGKKLNDNIDTNISSRLASVDYVAPDNANILYIKNMVDYLEGNIAIMKNTGEDTNNEIKNYNNYKADLTGLAQETSVQTAISDINSLDADIVSIKSTVEDTNTTVKVYNNYKADVSALALQTTLNLIKADIDILDSNLSLVKTTGDDTNATVKVYNNYKADISSLALEASTQTVISLLNNLNNLAAEDIWDYLKTNANTPNSIGKFIVDSLNSIISSISSQTGILVPAIWDYLANEIGTSGSIGVYLKEYLADINNTTISTNNEVKDYDNYKADISALALEATNQEILTNSENIENKIDVIDTNVDNIKVDTTNLITKTDLLVTEVTESINLLMKYKRILNVANNEVELYDSEDNLVATIELSETSVTQTQIFRAST